MRIFFKRPSVLLHAFAAALLWTTFVLAQGAPNLRLYVLDGGLLTNARPEGVVGYFENPGRVLRGG
jgi:hypothetical protein